MLSFKRHSPSRACACRSAVGALQLPQPADGHTVVHMHVCVPSAQGRLPRPQQDGADGRVLEGSAVRRGSCSFPVCAFSNAYLVRASCTFAVPFCIRSVNLLCVCCALTPFGYVLPLHTAGAGLWVSRGAGSHFILCTHACVRVLGMAAVFPPAASASGGARGSRCVACSWLVRRCLGSDGPVGRHIRAPSPAHTLSCFNRCANCWLQLILHWTNVALKYTRTRQQQRAPAPPPTPPPGPILSSHHHAHDMYVHKWQRDVRRLDGSRGRTNSTQ